MPRVTRKGAWSNLGEDFPEKVVTKLKPGGTGETSKTKGWFQEGRPASAHVLRHEREGQLRREATE